MNKNNGTHAATDLNERTRQELLETNAPMVRSIAKRMAKALPRSVQFDDLYQDGALGLLDSVLRYNRQLTSEQFKALASRRIRGAILDGLRAIDPGSRRIRRTMRKAETAIHQLQQKFGREPSESEVANAIGIPLADYQRKLQQADGYTLLSLEDFEGTVESGSYLEFCAEKNTDPAVALERRIFRNTLANALQRLPQHEKSVVSHYYEGAHTMREIGDILGLSEGRISQIHTQAIARLRACLLEGHETPVALTPRRRVRND